MNLVRVKSILHSFLNRPTLRPDAIDSDLVPK
jgi:hypothetical protein